MPASYKHGVGFSNEVISAAFDTGFEVVQPHLQPLITTVPMGDGEGDFTKYYQVGAEAEPREMWGDPEHFDKIGTYVFEIRPKTYHGGMMITDEQLADARIPIAADKARQMGSKAAQFIEKTLVADVVESTTAVDGFDGQPLYSTDHDWDTSDLSPGYPVVGSNAQSNIYAAGRTTDYANTTNVIDDWFGALAQMHTWVDDKGSKLHSGEGTYYILANNQSASLMRYLRLAFVEATRPGDDTDRDGFMFNVNLVFSPHLDSTAGSTDQDWYIFHIPPGQKAPLVLQDRQSVQIETHRDVLKHMNYWQYTMRFGVSWTNWWNTIKVNNS